MKKLIISVLMLIASSAQAATYYVATTGNDANIGTSLTQPVKTINRALNMAQATNDTIYVRGGVYPEFINIARNNLILSAYSTEIPVIDGASLPGQEWVTALSVEGNYNTVIGFEVKNVNLNKGVAGGFGVEASGHHNIFDKVNVHHTWEQGVMLHGDYNTFKNGRVWQAGRINLNGVIAIPGSVPPSGMSAGRNNSPSALHPGITSYPTFTGNKIYNVWGEGLSCFETDHCVMSDNIVYDNWAINIYLSDSVSGIINRNIVYISTAPAITFRNGNTAPAIVMADEVANGTTIPKSQNNWVHNNFIFNSDLQAFAWTLAPSGLRYSTVAYNTIIDGALITGDPNGGDPITNVGSNIKNNIIIDNELSSVPSNVGITFANNNWNSAPPALALSPTDILADGQVARVGTTTPGTMTYQYFRILSTSPNVNEAVVISNLPTDWFKVTRGSLPDIGAHEVTP